MPMLIEHLDAIARKKGRDVLFLDFPQRKNKNIFDLFNMDWGSLPIRQQVIAWLDQNQIEWRICGGFADENSMGMGGYLGRIYVDVPFDTNDSVYQELSNYLETPSGKMKFKGIEFCYLPLEMAMKNAHHDKPGFWERWAEGF